MTTDATVVEDFWLRLRAPFPPEEIEKKPQVVKGNDDDRGKCIRNSSNRAGWLISADEYYCGGYHARAIHIDYVGHAGLTMRLNDICTPAGWSWEPLAYDELGMPRTVQHGMWIKLTITPPGGEPVTKLGFGDPGRNTGGNGVKETIGDALRNAALRFGVATYLWGKSDRAKSMAEVAEPEPVEPSRAEPSRPPEDQPVGQGQPQAQQNKSDGVSYQFTEWLRGMLPDLRPEQRKDKVVAAFITAGVGDIGDAKPADWQRLWDDWRANGIPLDRSAEPDGPNVTSPPPSGPDPWAGEPSEAASGSGQSS